MKQLILLTLMALPASWLMSQTITGAEEEFDVTTSDDSTAVMDKWSERLRRVLSNPPDQRSTNSFAMNEQQRDIIVYDEDAETEPVVIEMKTTFPDGSSSTSTYIEEQTVRSDLPIETKDPMTRQDDGIIFVGDPQSMPDSRQKDDIFRPTDKTGSIDVSTLDITEAYVGTEAPAPYFIIAESFDVQSDAVRRRDELKRTGYAASLVFDPDAGQTHVSVYHAKELTEVGAFLPQVRDMVSASAYILRNLNY